MAAEENRRPGYFVFRSNGTIDSKVFAKAMDDAVKREFDEITSIIMSVRPIMFAAQMAQRNFNALEALEHNGAAHVPFASLPSSTQIETVLLYKIDACRNILNFLCSFRAFLDHCDAYLCRNYGNSSNERARFKSNMSLQYDTKFSYRFCYKLRNYAQHFSIPVSDASLTFSMDHGKGNYRLASTLYLERDVLLQWNEWGKVRHELERISSKLEILPLIKDAATSVDELCCSILKERADELIRCSDYLHRVCSMLKLEPGAIPVIWVGENATAELPPRNMEIVPIDELRLIVRSIGAPV